MAKEKVKTKYDMKINQDGCLCITKDYGDTLVMTGTNDTLHDAISEAISEALDGIEGTIQVENIAFNITLTSK